jgi:hypothetical protein
MAILEVETVSSAGQDFLNLLIRNSMEADFPQL